MNLKKRALHLAVTAGMVGSLVAVAAPAAHAASVYPDFCGVYFQGNVDPAGGLIPAGIIPFPVTGNDVGQKAYVLVGHEVKGQSAVVNDLNNTAAGATRFSIGVNLGGTVTASTRAVTGATWSAAAGGTIVYTIATTPTPYPYIAGQVISVTKSKTALGYNKTNVAINSVGVGTVTIIGTGADPGAYVSSALLSLTAPAAPVLAPSATGTSSIKIKWANDSNGLGPKMHQIQVADKDATQSAAVSKGFVTSMGAADRLGAQVGSINAGASPGGDAANSPGPTAGVGAAPSSSTFGLYVPPAATAGTFQLSMAFPSIAPVIGGNTYHSGAINVATWGATPAARAATIAASLNTPVAPPLPPDGGTFGNLGGGVGVTPGTILGTFIINFTGAGLGGSLGNQPLPSLSALLTPPPVNPVGLLGQTGALATTVGDDGSLHNAWRNGGVDAGLTPVSSLGSGIFTSQGMMASGNIPTIGNKNVGKWYTNPDVQYLFLHYPAGLVAALVPGLSSAFLAQGLLQSIVGANLAVTLDPCGVLGILGLFCTAASASIPPAFSGICGLL